MNLIFYEGQIYDAYSLLMDIISTAKEEIIVIDHYASKELLDLLKFINVKILFISGNIDEVLKINIKNNIIMSSLLKIIHFMIDLL